MRSLAIAAAAAGLLAATSSPARADDSAEPRITAWVGTGITAACIITATVSYFRYQSAIDDHKDKIASSEEQRQAWKDARDDAKLSRTIALYTLGGAIVSGAITGFLWTRTEKPKAQPTFQLSFAESGASALLTRSF